MPGHKNPRKKKKILFVNYQDEDKLPTSEKLEMAPSGETTGANNSGRSMVNSAPLTDAFDEQVRPFIDLIDKLRAYGLDQDVNLPAVAVIGDQSAGKSSTLEAISGIQLPRGSGIVTRCPLVLRLKSTVRGEGTWQAVIRYRGQDGQSHNIDIEEPHQVGDMIKEAQNRIAGDQRGISKELITLDVESRDVPDLTLIDLPGITRVAVEGQPCDIPAQIKRLITERVEKQETIILAVIPANVDIATTEALQVAQEFDPEGERTLGVITKPDLIDRGTENELIAVVNNQRCPLAKGYTVVKCRGQQSITDGQTLEEALEAEQQFFENAKHFRDVDKSLMGIKNLSQKLTEELVAQIKRSMPHLREEVEKQIADSKDKLQKLGVGVPEHKADKLFFLVKLLTTFCDKVKQVCNGDYTDDCKAEHRLYTQARHIYDTLLASIAAQVPVESNRDFISKIMEESEGHRGSELPRFMNYRVCQRMIRDVINRYRKYCEACIISVEKMVDKIVSAIATEELAQFPTLCGEVKLRVSKLQHTARQICRERINEIFDMEQLVFTQDRIYNHDLDTVLYKSKNGEMQTRKEPNKAVSVSHDDHVNVDADRLARGHQLASTTVVTMRSQEVKQQEAQDMYNMIKAYLEVSTRRMVDYVPLTIQLQLVKKFAENVTIQIITMAAEPDSVDMIKEDRKSAADREQLRKKLERLQLAEMEMLKF